MVEPHHEEPHKFDNCPPDGGMCEGGFEILMGFLSVVLFICLTVFCLWCYFTKKPNQVNLEMIEHQDQVIKTYQIA